MYKLNLKALKRAFLLCRFRLCTLSSPLLSRRTTVSTSYNSFSCNGNSININGKKISGLSGSNISIVNGVVTVDGKVVDGCTNEHGQLTINLEGTIDTLTCDESVSINGGRVGQIDAKGSVNCDNVDGPVKAAGSVNCDDVNGDVHAGGSVNCDAVGGSLTAGGSVICG